MENEWLNKEVVSNVEQSYEHRINEIKDSIERIGIKQDEIKVYIAEIDQSIKATELDVQNAKNSEQRLRLRVAIQKNTELIAKLYDSISNFESIRQRYQENMGKLTESKLRFINIELYKLEQQTNMQSTDVIKFVSELKSYVQKLSGSKSTVKKVQNELKESREYSME